MVNHMMDDEAEMKQGTGAGEKAREEEINA